MDLPSLAIGILSNAIARWVGSLEGKAASRLIDSVKVAQIQMDVASGLVRVAESRPDMTDDDRRKLLHTAGELVNEARADVRRAAAGVALAVPREVEAAFDNFAESAAKAAVAVAEQAKETLVWYFAIAAALLYALDPLEWRRR
jgi:hypothetical protein